MSCATWLKKINKKYRKINRELVRTRANDPRWPNLGDYYAVNTKNNAIVCRHINFAKFAKRLGGGV